MTPKAPLLVLLPALLAFASTATAQTPAPQARAAQSSGLSFGVRAGYGIPMGKLGAVQDGAQSSVLSDGVSGMIPLMLDLGYRVNPNFHLGVGLQYGFGIINSDKIGECSDCSIHDIAITANASYHLSPDASFDPWFGIGLGYEILNVSLSVDAGTAGALDASEDISGFQFLILQFGGDFLASPNLSIGPFLSFSFGQYGSVDVTASQNGSSRSMSQDLSKKDLHEWLILGIKGQFNL
jgi:opacity protein-like surface antigen